MIHKLVKVKKLHPDAVVPQYATEGAAGFDLVAIENATVFPGQTVLVKTGLAIEVEKGYEMQVRPRSGTSLKTSLRIANAPGTIDSDYRGEVGIIVTNIANSADQFLGLLLPTQIKKGERIAQGVIAPVVKAYFEVVEELSDTNRGEGGFGSTGK